MGCREPVVGSITAGFMAAGRVQCNCKGVGAVQGRGIQGRYSVAVDLESCLGGYDGHNWNHVWVAMTVTTLAVVAVAVVANPSANGRHIGGTPGGTPVGTPVGTQVVAVPRLTPRVASPSSPEGDAAL